MIGDVFSKITCYKRAPSMGPLDADTGGIFHVAAVGETNDAATDLVPSTAPGLVQSFWVVPIDDIPPGWWGVTQDLDAPEPLQPCPDLVTITKSNNRRTITSREMYPCSVGFSGRWYWFHIAPAGGISRQGCVSPPSKNVGSSNILSDDVQAFCSNVPDGFMCPVTCNKNRAPIGEVHCEDGVWSRTLRCRPFSKVCLSGVAQLRVTANDISYFLKGVVPDGRSECDLFSRKGKKCGAVCNEQGEFGCGQIKCVRSNRRRVGAPTGLWEAANNRFDCKNPTTDALVNRPTIVKLEPDGENIKITADIVKDPEKVISPISTFIFRETTGVMTCTAPEQNAMELSRNNEDDEPDDPEEADDDEDDDEAGDARRLSLVPEQDEEWSSKLHGLSWNRRLQTADVDSCNDDADFTKRNNQCFPDGNDGSKCNSCSALDLANSADTTCWAKSRRSRECATDPRSGDFLSCQFEGQFNGQAQACYAKPPEGFCVKKVCAKQGGSKFCRTFDPPTSGQFCVGDSNADPIDHVVVRYTCCNPNLLTFTGSCGGGNPDDIPKYEVMAGARNDAGTSWSLPVSLTCAPMSARSQLNREKYEIPETCSADRKSVV